MVVPPFSFLSARGSLTQGLGMRYHLAENNFRYSNRVAKEIDDSARAEELVCGVVGKWLFYVVADCQI